MEAVRGMVQIFSGIAQCMKIQQLVKKWKLAVWMRLQLTYMDQVYTFFSQSDFYTFTPHFCKSINKKYSICNFLL